MLLDFGIAKTYIPGVSTTHGARGASPGYSPIEQYGKSGGTDVRSDIYALGATLYDLLTGETPPESTDRVQNDLLKAPRRLNSALSVKIEQFLLKAMGMRMEHRYQNMKEVCAALFSTGFVLCPKCSKQNAEGKLFCDRCGEVLVPLIKCPGCKKQTPAPPAASFCGLCGYRFP